MFNYKGGRPIDYIYDNRGRLVEIKVNIAVFYDYEYFDRVSREYAKLLKMSITKYS